MPFNDSMLNIGAQAMADAIDEISLHSATPDATGSNETTAARQVPSFSVSDGDITMSAPEDFTGGAANGPVAAVGCWSTGNVWRGYFAITGDASFNSAGEYTLDSLVVTGS